MNKFFNIKWLPLFLLAFSCFLISCEDDDVAPTLDTEARFSADITDSTGVVSFLNLSSNADSYSWNFGDGNSSTEINPTHTYADSGSYAVVLEALGPGAPSSFQDVIHVVVTDGSTGGGDTGPTEAAPAPTREEADVISVFSDVYTDVTVDTWRTDWSDATFEEVTIQDNPTLKYSALNFVGIETVANQLDINQMTHVHMDLWSSDLTGFGFKIVDFGADGAFDGGDDTEHQVDVATFQTGQWVSVDIPLSDFTGLMNKSNIAQFVLVGVPGGQTVYVDNFYFYNDGSTGGEDEPTAPAPTPTRDQVDVISLFSDAYTDVMVDTWRTDWSAADFEDISVAGDAVKKYSNLDFVGIETVMNQIDASSMTHIHFDVWSPDFTFLGIKLVDFGADGAFGGGDDTEYQINDENTMTGQWVSYDLPIADFIDLAAQQNIAQYVFVAQPTGSATIYLDNIYFYNDDNTGGGDMPTMAAPAPTRPAANVISLFSDVYTDVMVDTWRTDWSAADFEDASVAGDAVKKYSNLDFVGIETVMNQVDASSMTHIHFDVWSPDFTFLGIKLVDFGADGAFGGGDDTEYQINDENTMTGQWVSYDIPLADFTDLAAQANIAQYIFVGQPTGTTTVYLDNIYFYNEDNVGGGDDPTVAAPTPTLDPANVISLFSDAYSDVPVDTWRTDWSSATYEAVTVDGNATHKYSELDFVGIETVSNQIDATSMTHIHIDVWSADHTNFGIKLVDFGADGAFGGGDDVEHQINFDMPATKEWVSYDIPLTDFTGLTTRANMAQYILVGQPTSANTIYVDNVYFHN